MRRLDLVGSACSSSVFRWMKTFLMVFASCKMKRTTVEIWDVTALKKNQRKSRKGGYLENLRSWFIVRFGIFGHQVNILRHSVDTFIVSNLGKKYKLVLVIIKHHKDLKIILKKN